MIRIKICFAYQMNANVKSESEKKRQSERARETKARFSHCKLLSRFFLSLFVYMEMRSLLMALSRLELIIE